MLRPIKRGGTNSGFSSTAGLQDRRHSRRRRAIASFRTNGLGIQPEPFELRHWRVRVVLDEDPDGLGRVRCQSELPVLDQVVHVVLVSGHGFAEPVLEK